ncbi:nucleoside deaminase [Methylosinus sp. LW4]|uniref:nucleoside deaminase n=1 Tax=Methylosinus sp. LW4 TaxID=136993 RepID=UPI00039C1AB4|nr:nucleoside deaminase [Methylosinus sp. LW4]
MRASDIVCMDEAFRLAKKSFDEGGLPIGSVLAEGDRILGRGHNRRVQQGDPILHGEMDCLRDAGRRASYRETTLYTTLSPCMMCAGTIVQFKIPRVIVGENRNFGGNEQFLRDHGVEVILLDDARCRELMRDYIAANPSIWNEDIAEDAPREGAGGQ